MDENLVICDENDLCLVCEGRATSGKLLRTVACFTAGGQEMMEYCLDIQLDDKIAAMACLCGECCINLTSLYTFKRLARESLARLQHVDVSLKYEKQDNTDKHDDMEDEVATKCSNIKIEDEVLLAQVKEEICFENVDFVGDSDEELLSVLKSTKFEETVETETKRIIKKKRGRPKMLAEPKVHRKAGICDLCGKSVRCLTTHLKCHQPDGSRRRIPCKLCDKTFASFSSKYRHTKIKHMGIKQFCTKCQKSVCHLRQHELQMHSPDKLPMLCVVCNRRFPNRSSLDQHTTVHTRVKQHECPDCGQHFRLKVTMLNHKRRVHDGEKTHLCQYCSKGFFKKYHLNLHLRLHTNERPMECGECGKLFRTDSGLRMHLKRHRGLRDHVCTVCDMAFFNNGALTVHMVTHTKERRYQCAYCDSKFGRSDHRNRHERTAHHKTQSAAIRAQ